MLHPTFITHISATSNVDQPCPNPQYIQDCITHQMNSSDHSKNHLRFLQEEEEEDARFSNALESRDNDDLDEESA